MTEISHGSRSNATTTLGGIPKKIRTLNGVPEMREIRPLRFLFYSCAEIFFTGANGENGGCHNSFLQTSPAGIKLMEQD
jgi:hypothetical protein